ncbi:regulatory protein RecX [Kordia algicida OT-1]|uniref:Regulatory protein RecX n=1 Tax=Kordia algicida OT-1 TaxID=391587 RepID=A9DL91_9FLAO|nr:regulatory protein RecX [Kordia algicida]EDP98509.1 regulatory protein RecX [Kordia algicida OT-1]
MKNDSYSLTEAKLKLQQFCAYQDRCHKEVVEKLQKMNMIPEAIDMIVSELIQDNFLNEERFAQSFARGKFRIKKWGKLRITRELKLRQISKYNIETALKEIEETDYLDTLDELARKRNEAVRETNMFKRKKKIADYLFYRGWEAHLVYEKINELVK